MRHENFEQNFKKIVALLLSSILMIAWNYFFLEKCFSLYQALDSKPEETGGWSPCYDFLWFFELFCYGYFAWTWEDQRPKDFPYNPLIWSEKKKSREPTTHAYKATMFGEELSEHSSSVENRQKCLVADPPFRPCGRTVPLPPVWWYDSLMVGQSALHSFSFRWHFNGFILSKDVRILSNNTH